MEERIIFGLSVIPLDKAVEPCFAPKKKNTFILYLTSHSLLGPIEIAALMLMNRSRDESLVRASTLLAHQ